MRRRKCSECAVSCSVWIEIVVGRDDSPGKVVRGVRALQSSLPTLGTKASAPLQGPLGGPRPLSRFLRRSSSLHAREASPRKARPPPLPSLPGVHRQKSGEV